ncbi:hypothetical protein [Pseudoalteromonas piscicida]|uniref:hypothetical protein n=1 Tax=Pseudoalteromonas piscicida TaxID=43662 RepID=UPI0030A9EC1E
MMNNTITGVDLVSKVIQVCICAGKKMKSNVEMSPEQFTVWLFTQSLTFIVFEACGTSNYWKQ